MGYIKQRKLALEEAEKVRTAFRALTVLSFFNSTSDGVDYWLNVCGKLGQMICTGTTDGKPYVEPERWRVPTDEDARMRPECRVRDCEDDEWTKAILYAVDEQCDKTQECEFLAKIEEDDAVFNWWSYCEILDNETKTE